MRKIDLEKKQKIYFIGIGGIGMSAIARMFILQGKQVFGSDLSGSEVTDELVKLGAEIKIGEPKEAVSDNVDLVVYTVAVPENQIELKSARERNLDTLSYPEILGLISENKFTIAVAGTHGKTTTTAMIAQILIEAGLDPTVIVGSLLKNHNSNFIAGKSKYFLAEACEYKRSFLNFKPDIAVITNIDRDHLDYYGDLAGIQAGFKDFLLQVKPSGVVVTDKSSENLRPVIAGSKNKIIDYQSFKKEFSLKIPGRHNILNAQAAFAVASFLGIPESNILKSLRNFSGTWRRFDWLGQSKLGAQIYDDYAHHPTEIQATLNGFKERFPDKRLIVAFQPHLYSRTKEHYQEFAPAFALAAEVLILPIYAAREPNDGLIDSEMLARDLSEKGLNVRYFDDFESTAKYLNHHLGSNDIFLTMGAGDVYKLAQTLTS